MPPLAYVVHRSRRRLRLRVPERCGDTEWFEQAASYLRPLAWVDEVETGALSGSLVLHVADSAMAEHELSGLDLFAFAPQPPALPSTAQQLKSGLVRVNRAMKQSSSGGADLRSLLLVAMLLLAGAQMLRGQIMVPAISLLWYALELVLGARESTQEPPNDADDR